MKNIFITRHIPESGIDFLKNKGYEVVINKSNKDLSKQELIQELKKIDYDAILCLLTNKIDKDILDAAPKVAVIANYAVGYDNFDINAIKERGVIATNTPNVLTNAVAEHTIALLFAAAKRVVEGDSFVRNKEFTGWEPELFIGTELKDKNLTILGGGRIGMRVAEMAHFGLGMNINYFDKQRNEELENKCNAKYIADLKTALKESDCISIHLPLFESTKGLIGKEEFSLMKKNTILINTARGPIIDEGALVEALKNGEIRSAGLDVFENEPDLHPDLYNLKNVVLTPHTASATVKTREAMSMLAAENIDAVLQGRDALTPINL